MTNLFSQYGTFLPENSTRIGFTFGIYSSRNRYDFENLAENPKTRESGCIYLFGIIEMALNI